MQIVVVGLNEQGLQRQKIAGTNCVALVANLQEIPINSYDAVIICATNENKFSLARFALVNKKHVLLDAPLWGVNLGQLDELEQLAVNHSLVFYISHSFRFVAEFIQAQQVLEKKQLGEINHCRLSYAANSDQHYNGALIDLSAHLLNLLCSLLGPEIMQNNFSIVHKDKFGRQVIFADFNARCTIEIEANFFASVPTVSAEIFGARDNLHIRYVGDAAKAQELLQLDYLHFQELCRQQPPVDCLVDKWIYAELDRLSCEEVLLA